MRFSASYQPLCHVLGGDALERAQVYGGLGMRDIRERKRLKPGQQVLDHIKLRVLPAEVSVFGEFIGLPPRRLIR